MLLCLTRRIKFTATHYYRVAAWSDEQNAESFGELGKPHAHAYTCEVSVSGPPDAVTGFIADLAALDRALRTEVTERFDARNINRDVPEFGDGGLLPNGENLARFIGERVQAALGETIRVIRVVVAENPSLSATYEP